MVSLALAAAVGIGILLAWLGWGALLNAALGRDPKLDWGQKGAWGLAFLIVVGGVLEVSRAVSRPLILGLLGVGMFLWLIDVIRGGRWRRFAPQRAWAAIRSHKLATVIGVLIVAAIAARYLESVQSLDINPHDDGHAYLVFANRMLQTGCLGDDPYNHRRLVGALGGKSFLDTWSLSTGSIFSLHLIDAGLGTILVAGLLWGRFRRRGAGAVAGACIMLLMLLLPPPRVNMTALMLGTALLLGLFQTLESAWLTRQRPIAGMVIIALLSAALFALKNTFIPPTALTLALSYLFYLRGSGSWRRALVEGGACALLLALFLLPWMLSLYRSSGTLLYPLLGKGYDASRYGRVGLTDEFRTVSKTLLLVRVAVTQPMFLGVAATAALVLIGRGRSWFAGRGAVIALALGTAVAAVIIVLVTTASGKSLEWGANRYCFPILLAAFLALLSVAAEMAAAAGAGEPPPPPGRPRLGRWRSAGLVVVGLLLAGGYLSETQEMFRGADRGIRQAVKGLPEPPPAAVIRPAQNSVPAGEPILARLGAPFLLDFQRNRIFVVDHPALASPPPGMPAFAGPEALAGYLRGQRIRYVAFSYLNEANYSYARFGNRVHPGVHPLWRTLASHAFDFNRSLQELGRTRRRIYDDGRIFVLDLEDPVGGASPARR